MVLPPDARNTRGISDTVSVQIQQRQVTGFSIQSSNQLIPYNSQATISGVVDQPGTTNPDVGAEREPVRAHAARWAVPRGQHDHHRS